jgi:adenylosuccinate synthase
VADLLDSGLLKATIENACREKNMIAHALFNSDPLDADSMYAEYARAAAQIAPFVADTAVLLNHALAKGESVMFEGAQATMLDIDHGTYPFVTSSSCTAGGASTGTGVPPNAIQTVIGVTKAYCTRVGEGPFPSEVEGPVADQLRARGKEYGAVTGRSRRCGWIDLPLLRYAQMINGVNWWVVTKLDVLDVLDEIPVCVGYKIKGKKVDSLPALATGFEQVECIYEKMPGWKKSTEGATSFDDLPKKAQAYLRFIERESGARIGMVSTGPERDQTMMLPEFAAEILEDKPAPRKGAKAK